MANIGLLDRPKRTQGLTSVPAPKVPKNLIDTGLSLGFLTDLLLKQLLMNGTMLGMQLSRRCSLPFNILEEGLLFLKDEKCIEISGGDLIGAVSYRFNLTDQGRQRARTALETCAYIGPAPVPIEDYRQQCTNQLVTGVPISPDGLRSAFAHLVITEELIQTVGPAIVSGRAVFIYGPPGTGKTAIASTVGNYLNSCGGEIYIPHAIIAEESVISMYDPIVHHTIDDEDQAGPDQTSLIKRLMNEDTVDGRWKKIRRPVIITGGELTLDMLDLQRSELVNVYQAPLHIKANGGVFLIDDFGRQLCTPKELLNRWIMPLEGRQDYLALASGKKFMVPFEQLTIFSTNMNPKDLVDDAFLRRIRHKIGVDAPPRDVYEQIFNMYCRKNRLNECPEAIDYLYDNYYDAGRRISRPSDCRDLLEIVVSLCRFRQMEPQLDCALIAEASSQFFAQF